MKKFIENTAYWVGILTLGIVVGVTIKIVGAWVEPNQMPPGGNIAAPFNTGNIGQSKLGGLTLNIGGATYGLIVDKGLVGIKTTTPQTDLDVNGDIAGHNLNLNNNLSVGGDTNITGNLNINGTLTVNGNTNDSSIDWSNPVSYSTANNRNPKSTSVSTPTAYKLCIMQRVYIELSGRCEMTRNNDSTWTLLVSGATTPGVPNYNYVDCSMYCYK